MKTPIFHRGQLLLSLLLGALYPLALSPFNWPLLGLASSAGLAALLYRQTSQPKPLKSLFTLAYGFGLGLFGAGVSWVYVSIHTYGQAPVALAGLMTAVFAAFLALVFALPFLLLGLIRQTPSLFVMVFPSIWTLGEWVRGWLLTGFPWLYLGHGHTDTWLAGWAPLTGVLGISWIGACTAAAVALILLRAGSLRLQSITWMTVIALWITGYGLQDVEWTSPEPQPLKVALIQPSLPLEQKWDSSALQQILSIYREQTDKVWDSDLIIWPESAIPRLLEDVRPFLVDMDSAALEQGNTIITGIPTRIDRAVFNSVVVLGNGSGIYHKRHLVPFGEYVPLEQWLRGLIRFFDLPMSAFSNGPDQQALLTAGDHTIATAICYEIVYQDLVAFSASHAQLLLTVSNDTWFGDSIGPHQHFQIARMRAIENRKPLLRGTNDGITAIVDHHGHVTDQLPQFEQGILTGTLTPRTGTTPFNHLGSWPMVILSLLITIASAGLGRRIHL